MSGGSPHQMSPEEIFSLVRSELELVERELERSIAAASPLVSSMGQYLREGGGKRVRPALLLLSAKLVAGRATDSAIRMAAVMEMLHTATLVHDDIIDDAKVRRGRPSANAKWGNDVTVLMGDWLYMTAFDMTLRERNFDILDLLTNMTRLMTEGEIIQLGLKGNSRITEEEHLDIVRRKTAYMFSASAEVGAIVAGATPEQRRALRDYGLLLGMAFQLVDDILDFVSTEEKLGKPIANDLREGKLTLPVIYLLEGGNQEYRRIVEAIIQEGEFKTISRGELLELLEREGALERARASARRYAEEAARALSPFPQSDFKRALVSVSHFVVERQM